MSRIALFKIYLLLPIILGKAELFIEEPDAKLCANSTDIDNFCNGRHNEDVANDSDDNPSKQADKTVTDNIFMSPAPKAISKHKGNRLKIRSRSPSPFTSTPNKSQQLHSDYSNSINTTPSSLNNTSNSVAG